MRTKKYTLLEYNQIGQVTAFEEVEETYTDRGKQYKQHTIDHLRNTINDWEDELDSLERAVHKSNEEHTYRTIKDEDGRFVSIEHIRHVPFESRTLTTISYYENSNAVYQEIINDDSYIIEKNYTYFGRITQIEQVTRYKDGNGTDSRELILFDDCRKFCTKYDLSSQRIVERSFAYFNKIYQKAISYGDDGEQHTHMIREEHITEHESHICEYEDGVLTSREVTLSLVDPVTKMAWQMQETTDLKTNTRSLDRIWITQTLKGERPVLLW